MAQQEPKLIPRWWQRDSNIPKHTQTYSNNRRQQTTTDNNRRQQTTTDDDRRQQTTTNEDRRQQTTTDDNRRQQTTTDDTRRQQTITVDTRGQQTTTDTMISKATQRVPLLVQSGCILWRAGGCRAALKTTSSNSNTKAQKVNNSINLFCFFLKASTMQSSNVKCDGGAYFVAPELCVLALVLELVVF